MTSNNDRFDELVRDADVFVTRYQRELRDQVKELNALLASDDEHQPNDDFALVRPLNAESPYLDRPVTVTGFIIRQALDEPDGITPNGETIKTLHDRRLVTDRGFRVYRPDNDRTHGRVCHYFELESRTDRFESTAVSAGLASRAITLYGYAEIDEVVISSLEVTNDAIDQLRIIAPELMKKVEMAFEGTHSTLEQFQALSRIEITPEDDIALETLEMIGRYILRRLEFDPHMPSVLTHSGKAYFFENDSRNFHVREYPSYDNWCQPQLISFRQKIPALGALKTEASDPHEPRDCYVPYLTAKIYTRDRTQDGSKLILPLRNITDFKSFRTPRNNDKSA